MRPDYFTDRTHFLVTGVTGARSDFGGKTSLATWWADTHGREAFDVVLFFNPKLDDGPEKHADAVARSVEEVGAAIGDGATFVCLSPTNPDWKAVTDRFQQFVQALPNDMSKFVVLDEAPELDQDAIKWFVRVAGNGNETKTLVLSQEPGAVAGRKQCVLIWVGPVQENNRHVFRANNRENHFDWMKENHDPYHWSVMLGPGDDDRDTYSPVPEEYA